MSRVAKCASFVSFRSLSSGNLPLPLPGLTPEAQYFLDKVRVLSVRGHLKEALSLFYTLEPPPHLHSQQTYATLFHACARLGFRQEGLHLHSFMLSQYPNDPPNLFVTNHLVNMYCKFGYLDYAHQLFDQMPQRNVVSWTALISGYAQHNRGTESFRLFSDMFVYYRPNEFAFASVLSSCDYEHGKQVHVLALKMSLDSSIYVANALISMYSHSCGSGGAYDSGRDEAWTVFETMEFRNLISWNSMIAGFQSRNLAKQAINLFMEMHHLGIGCDRATLLSVFLSLCGRSGVDANLGRNCCFQFHCLSIKTGLILEIEVATALIKAFSDLGGFAVDCYMLFSETSSCRDSVSWVGIITAFAERDPEGAMFLFRQMRHEDFAPDKYTYSIVLKACAGFVTELHTLAVHSQIFKVGLEGDTVVANALIHAYARCGFIRLSKQVFDEMSSHDLVSWNSILKAYALHGQGNEALQLFSEMTTKPDAATFVSLLSACSHTGLVDEGTRIFDSMAEVYDIVPELDHYACMVDLLGRAGKIRRAEDLIRRMPVEPDYVVWSALLGSCRKHHETELAKLAAAKLKELDPGNSLGYVQMSNIYCSDGDFREAGLIRKEMKGIRVRKEPGLSWIEVGSQVHEFASGGRRHPQKEAICTKLKELIGQLKEIGYAPETKLALHDIEEEHKEEELIHHSEKLALAFAIMNEGSLNYGGSLIRIMKNIRICIDCHNFMKLASRLLEKEVVVRDSNRFHHFKIGECSCNDYW